MALYQIIHFIGIVAIGHQELWLVEVLFTRVTVSGLLFDWFSFINKLQIEQNLNIRSCTSSWCCIDDFISQELNVGLYLANRAVSDRTCWCRLCSCDNSLSLPKRLSMYQVGFRFAPKLHGILTKAQAVLQLFSLLAKRLMHYQVG